MSEEYAVDALGDTSFWNLVPVDFSVLLVHLVPGVSASAPSAIR